MGSSTFPVFSKKTMLLEEGVLLANSFYTRRAVTLRHVITALRNQLFIFSDERLIVA
jgi:hypothetical protein